MMYNKTLKILITILLLLFVIIFYFQDNDLYNKKLKAISFKGVIADLYVCEKDYLCVKLKNNNSDIHLSHYSCRNYDDIIVGDSLVKKSNLLSLSLYRKDKSGIYKFVRDYSTW